MKAYIVKSPIGIFALSSDGKILNYRLFGRSPQQAAKDFEESTHTFESELKDYTIEPADKETRKIFRKNVREWAISLGFVNSENDLVAFLSEFAAHLSKKAAKKSIAKDSLLIQATKAYDDLVKITNLLSERITEWYGLHYPESKLSHKELIEKIAIYGRRENWPSFKESIGIMLSDEDEDVITRHAKLSSDLTKQKMKLEDYIAKTNKEVIPNLSATVDTILAARLLGLAGSLEKLSKMTAPTIQLLGAEKALFRHVRGKGKPPKYGIIFSSSLLQNAPEQKRGKVARILAAKLMMAARIDYYSGRDEGGRLKKELDEEIKKI